MRSGRVFATTIAATALVGLAAPAATASVHPNPARPGDTVTISDDKRCHRSKEATAFSVLFGKVPLHRVDHHPDGGDWDGRPDFNDMDDRNNKDKDDRHRRGPLVGTAKIPFHAKPGTFKVFIKCDDGRKFVDHLRVIPRHGAKAGVGGSINTSNTAQIAGAAGVVAAVGGGAFLMMRRRADGRA